MTQDSVMRNRVINDTTRPIQMSFEIGRHCIVCREFKPLHEFTYDEANTKDGYRRTCLGCTREQAKMRQRVFRTSDPENYSAKRKQARQERLGQYRERERVWREKNRDKINAEQRARYQSDPEAKLARDREYNRANPDRKRAQNHARRTKEGPCDPAPVTYMGILRGDPCSYCGVLPGRPTVDHITAIDRGGTNEWANLTSACRSCNSSKHTADVLSFLLRRAA